MKARRWRGVAFAWDFAEATLFFLVPDVVLSLIAVRGGLREALVAGLFAAAGAVLGGAVLMGWAHGDPTGLERALDLVPAIGTGLIAEVKAEVASDWSGNMMRGAFVGIPYKLYAAAAGEQGLPVIPFLAMTFVARMPRFVLASLAAWIVGAGLRRRGWNAAVLPGLAIWWIGFYAVYLTTRPW